MGEEFGADLFDGAVGNTTSVFRQLAGAAPVCIRLLAWTEDPQLPRSFLFSLDWRQLSTEEPSGDRLLS